MNCTNNIQFKGGFVSMTVEKMKTRLRESWDTKAEIYKMPLRSWNLFQIIVRAEDRPVVTSKTKRIFYSAVVWAFSLCIFV